ncbi:MAG: TetR/AcrR family transcriptional regulator [Thermoleophilia bacterium]
MTDGPATPTRRMSGPERRAAILDAARGQFARHGFHGAATAAIARAAGCSEAILYRHFPSKRDLLVAVLRAEVEGRIVADRDLVVRVASDPAGMLPEVLRRRIEEGELQITARLVLLAISMSGDEEIGDAVRGAFEAIRGPLREVIAGAQADGTVRPDLDPEALTWIWHGLFLVALVRNSLAPDGVALGAVDAARVLAELQEPPRS